jgi:hypothetical protein
MTPAVAVLRDPPYRRGWLRRSRPGHPHTSQHKDAAGPPGRWSWLRIDANVPEYLPESVERKRLIAEIAEKGGSLHKHVRAQAADPGATVELAIANRTRCTTRFHDPGFVAQPDRKSEGRTPSAPAPPIDALWIQAARFFATAPSLGLDSAAARGNETDGSQCLVGSTGYSNPRSAFFQVEARERLKSAPLVRISFVVTCELEPAFPICSRQYFFPENSKRGPSVRISSAPATSHCEPAVPFAS